MKSMGLRFGSGEGRRHRYLRHRRGPAPGLGHRAPQSDLGRVPGNAKPPQTIIDELRWLLLRCLWLSAALAAAYVRVLPSNLFFVLACSEALQNRVRPSGIGNHILSPWVPGELLLQRHVNSFGASCRLTPAPGPEPACRVRQRPGRSMASG